MLCISSFGLIRSGDDILIGISKRKNITECIIGGKLNVVDIDFLYSLIDKYAQKDSVCLFDEYLKQVLPIIKKMNQIKLHETTVYKHTLFTEDDLFLENLFITSNLPNRYNRWSDDKSLFGKCEKFLASLTLKRELWEELGGLDVSLESLFNSHSYLFPDNIPNRYVIVFEIDVSLNALQKSEYGIKLLKVHIGKNPVDEIRLMKKDDLNKWIYSGSFDANYDINGSRKDNNIPPIRHFSIEYLQHIFPNNVQKNTANCSTDVNLVDAMKKLDISDNQPNISS